MKKSIDAPVAQLVLDLEERGLLNRTLIVLASEFSRDMMVEGKPDNKVKDQVTVPGLHFIQEDSAAAIGAAVADFIGTLK